MDLVAPVVLEARSVADLQDAYRHDVRLQPPVEVLMWRRAEDVPWNSRLHPTRDPLPTEMEMMNLSPEAASLLDRAQEWSKNSLEARQVESLQAYWTEDAILIPFEGPVVSGTPDLLDYFKQALGIPGFT